MLTGRRRAERQLVPGRRRGERHGDRVPHLLSRRQRARRSRRRARLVRRRRRHAEVPGVHGRGAEPHHDQPGQRGATAPSARIFQSTTPGRDIFVARSIYWGPNFEGSTGVSAVKGLSTSWYFAEGSRGGELFDNFFLVFNPLPTPTTVDVTFLTAAGEVITKQYPVAAQKRLTLYANAIPELAGKDFSTTITAATGVVAERAMYWRLIGSPDPSWVGGAASVGAIAPQTTWVFAEGRGRTELRVVLPAAQPEPDADHGAGPLPARDRHADGRRTSRCRAAVARDRLPERRARQHRRRRRRRSPPTRCRSWPSARSTGAPAASRAPTSSAPRRRRREWHFPEGASGGLFDTYLLLANPGTNDATVRLTLFIEGVGRFTASQPELLKTVRAGSRLTIYMNEFLTALETAEARPVGSLRGKSFSTKVDVLSGDPVVAEEALYWQLGRRQLLARRLGRVRHPASSGRAAAAPAGVAAARSLPASRFRRDFPIQPLLLQPID